MAKSRAYGLRVSVEVWAPNGKRIKQLNIGHPRDTKEVSLEKFARLNRAICTTDLRVVTNGATGHDR